MVAYSAVVFGCPVYNQGWLAEGERFLRRNRGALVERPVWLFSVGTFGDRKRLIGRLMRKEPRNIDELQEAIHPRDYRVFAGVIDPQAWPFLARVFLRALGGRVGDNRDWPDIAAWAEEIAEALQASAPR